LPNRIKQRREEMKISQQELAKVLRITPNYLNKIENERKPINVMLAIRIAQALDTTVEHLFLIES
jgi:DNA-binding XRE family transcriptional regulator